VSDETQVVSSFDFPKKFNRTSFSRLSYDAYHYFRFQFEPRIPPVSLDEMTAGDLAGWIGSTIQELREGKSLPFEIGHLQLVFKALQQAGASMPQPEPLPMVLSMGKCFSGSQFRAGWKRLATELGVTLPKPYTSPLGCVISLVIAAGPYVLFLMWFDKWAGPIGPGMKRSLSWLFLVGAIMLAAGISRLIAIFLPGPPPSCTDTSMLAQFIAPNKPLPPGKSLWTDAIVWEKTKVLVAAAFGVEPSQVHHATRLADLHKGA
jgi:hypothetical protein